MWYSRVLTRAIDWGRAGVDEAEAQLGRGDLYFLLRYLLGRKDTEHPWIFARCREVQGAPNGYLDVWSRGHYKSTIITYALTIQDILNDPEVTFGIFSHTRPIAKAFLRQIKREFEGNELLKRLYPDVLWQQPQKEAPQWSEDGGIVVKRRSNPKEATIEASGLIDGQPTSRHYRRRVYDDVVTIESVSTVDQINKTTAHWELSLNLGGGEAIERYIGTRYHLRDTYRVMLDRQAVKERRYPATHNGRLDGKPVFLTDTQWAEIKQKRSSTVIAAQQLQNPLADGQATFRTEWLRSYEVRPRILNVYIMADPSKGRSATSDNTAIAAVGVAPGGARFLLDGYCHRMTLSQRWTALRELYKRWSKAAGIRHVAVGYERYGAQSDDEYFQEQMERERFHFVIDELNWVRDESSGQSKRDRVERLEPDFRNGRFYLPLPVWHDGKASIWKVDTDPESKSFQTIEWREADGLTRAQRGAIEGGSVELIAKAIKRVDEDGRVYDVTARFFAEYEQFPFGAHDDLIDAVSRVYDMEPVRPVTLGPEATEPRQYPDS